MPKSWIVRGAEAAERSRRRMQLLGVTPGGHPLWTQWEVGPVVELARAYSLICPMLDRRTRLGVYSKSRRLGVAGKAPLPWSANEIVRLRKVYPKKTKEEVLSAFPGRSYSAVAKAANARGIHRADKPLRPTGNKVLDQILARARERNVSMEELGDETGKRAYFGQRRWRSGKFDFAAHSRAVAYLGGSIKVRWLSAPDARVQH